MISRVVVVASGTEPKIPDDIAGWESAAGRLFFDIRAFRDLSSQKIGIIGAGDAAFDYALSLSGRNYVWIFNRSRRTRCLPLLEQAVGNVRRIRYLPDRNLIGVETREQGINARFLFEEENEVHSLDYLIFAVGRVPATGFLTEALRHKFKDLEETGRLYIIGDAANGLHRQAVIAAGDGLRAAMKIKEYLDGRREQADYGYFESSV